MPMSEYELSLVSEAKKGKKKSLERLCDAFHKQLVEVIERELGSRDKAEVIIKKVNITVKDEIKHVRNPLEFERLIISLTITECANFPRGESAGQFAGAAATSFSEQKNDRAKAQMEHADEPQAQQVNAADFGVQDKPLPAWHQRSVKPEPIQRPNNWQKPPMKTEPVQPQNNWQKPPMKAEPVQPQNNWQKPPMKAEPVQPPNNWQRPPMKAEPVQPPNNWQKPPMKAEPVQPPNNWQKPPMKAEPVQPPNNWQKPPMKAEPVQPPNNWQKPPMKAEPVQLSNNWQKPPMKAEPVQPSNNWQKPPMKTTPIVPAPQQQNGSVPFTPGMQNSRSAVPMQSAVQNNRADSPRPTPHTSIPTEFKPLNMGNQPVQNAFRTPAQQTQTIRQPAPQSNVPPVSVQTAPPQAQIKDDSRTVLLTEEPMKAQAVQATESEYSSKEPKTTLLSEEPKTTLLQEEPKTTLLPEEPKTEPTQESQTDTVTEPCFEPSCVENTIKTEALPEEKTAEEPMKPTESEPAPVSEPITAPITEGELLFKPGEPSKDSADDTSKPVISETPKVGLLVCTKGDDSGENFSLKAGRNKIGVCDDCDVVIKDASLPSDAVFEIVYDERRENFTLVPGERAVRLFINNDYVDSSIFMQPHDTIRIGKSEFLLVSFK